MSGLDGTHAVEQVGTEAHCNGGSEQYMAWWEIYPNVYAMRLPLDLHAGDRVSARVTRSGRTFTMTLADLTTGRTESMKRSAKNGSSASVEWTVEAPCSGPTGSCTQLPLARFLDQVRFESALATSAGHVGSVDEPRWSKVRITMTTRHGTPMAAPSALSSSGTRFSVRWQHR